VTGEDCFHLEIRIQGSAAVRRSGIESVADLLDFDYPGFQRNSPENLSPEMVEDTDAVLRAIKEMEKGWQRAIDKIAERSCQSRGPHSTHNLRYSPRQDVRFGG
jgi:hypothetical protein